MRTSSWILLGGVLFGLAACARTPPSTDPSAPAGDPAPAGNPKELILGRWDLTKASDTGIAWDSLSDSLNSDNGLALEFEKGGRSLLCPEAGPAGLLATYSLGDDGVLEIRMQKISSGPQPPPDTLKLRAQVAKDELILKDEKGKTARFKRGQRPPVKDPLPAYVEPKPTPQHQQAAEAIQKAGGRVRFASSTGAFVSAGAPEAVPLYADVDLTQSKSINKALADLRPHLAQLPVLQLRLKDIDDTGLATLSNLANLDLLDLNSSPVTDAGMAQLTKLTNLRILRVKSAQLTDAVFAQVGALPKLEAFSVQEGFFGHRMTDASLAALKGLTRLRHLRIEGDKEKLTDAGLAPLHDMSELRSLEITGLDITDAALKELSGMTKLSNLKLSNCPKITGSGFAFFKGLKELHELELRDCQQLTPEGTAHLAALTGLNRFLIQRSFATPDHYRCLKGLVNLEEISIFEANFDDACLQHLAGLTRVRELSTLRGKKITDAGLKYLEGLTSLETLGLSKTQVKGPGLVHLKGCPKLRNLFLENTAVDDASLAALSGMTRLENLTLSQTQITDAGLVHLKDMTKLRHLMLDNTAVSDQGLDHLKGMTKLSSLSLQATKVTPAGIESLKKALPKARIFGPDK